MDSNGVPGVVIANSHPLSSRRTGGTFTLVSPDSPAGFRMHFVLSDSVMLRNFTASFAVVAALLFATVRLPAAPCFVTNTPGPKACEPGCCKNKSCCETSHQRTGPASQPLAKAGIDQQTFATVYVTDSV